MLSPSSSVSVLLPTPSESVSKVSLLSKGKASAVSRTPSASSSVSALLPVPSPSVSKVSLLSNGKASMASTTPSASSSASRTLGIPSSSVSNASTATTIFSNSLVVSVAVSKSVTATSPDTTFVTDSCNPSWAALTISKATSDNGSRFGSETTVFTAATEAAIAAITSTAITASGTTSAITLTNTAFKVFDDDKSTPSSDTAAVEICVATAFANCTETSVSAFPSSATVAAVCSRRPTCWLTR